MSGLDDLLADLEGLSVEPVASTPAPATRGKSTDGGGERPSVLQRCFALLLLLQRRRGLRQMGRNRQSVLG
jgi:hypothetical protein